VVSKLCDFPFLCRAYCNAHKIPTGAQIMLAETRFLQTDTMMQPRLSLFVSCDCQPSNHIANSGVRNQYLLFRFIFPYPFWFHSDCLLGLGHRCMVFLVFLFISLFLVTCKN